VFLLMAGEIYTDVHLPRRQRGAYGKGGPALLHPLHGRIAYAISYFLLPVVWRYAHRA